MKKRENNYAFVDSQNVNLSIKRQGWSLDWSKFRVHLKEKYDVQQAHLFIGYVPGNQPLYSSLQQAGLIVTFKPTLIMRDGTIKGNVDAELVLHAMIEYEHYDKAVIVTGDGDFHCLIDYLNRQNKLCRLLIPDAKSYSTLLRPFAPNRVDFMNNLRHKMEYKKSP